LTPRPDFELEFPRNRIEILGVSARSKNRSSALVSWSADSFVSCTGSPTGRLRVHLIDPAAKTAALEVVYRLVNFEATCRGRLDVEDLDVDPGSVRAYDRDGLPLAQLPGGLALPTVFSTTL
jgi:hypothetical protein